MADHRMYKLDDMACAAGPTRLAGLDFDDLIKCAICYEALNEPKTLPCLHTFCARCLTSLYQSQHVSFGNLDTIVCPQCRSRTIVPPEGVEGFPSDFKVSKILDALKKLNMTDERKTSKCDICKQNNRHIQATVHCVDCTKYLCGQCTERHHQRAVLADHRLCSVSIHDSEIPCREHANETLQFYCQTCRQGLCAVCCLQDRHVEHEVGSMTEGVLRCRQELQVRNGELTKRLSQVQDALRRMVDVENQTGEIFRDSLRLIKLRTRQVIANIERGERQMVLKLSDSFNSNTSNFRKSKDDLECYYHTLEGLYKASEQTTKSEDHLLLNGHKDLVRKIDQILTDDIVSKINFTDKIQLCKFKPGKKLSKLGRLESVFLNADQDSDQEESTETGLQSSKALFVSEISTNFSEDIVTRPSCIAFLPNGNIVIGDAENNKIQIFSATGVPVAMVTDEVKPRALAVFENDIVVADGISRTVRIYRQNGELAQEWGQFCTPSAVTLQGECFIVTDFYQNSLMRFSKSGELLQESEMHNNRSIGEYGSCQVAVDTSGNIYVSDIGDECITKFSSEFQIVMKYRLPQTGVKLGGVCVDGNGYVLVTDQSNNSIMMIDTETESVHWLLGPRAGLEGPAGIALSSSGLMAVCEPKRSRVKLYQLCNQTWSSSPNDSN